MKEIELLKTYNDWRRGSDIQQPKPTEIGHSVDFVLNELERLQAKNDELRAKLEEYDELSIQVTNLDQYGEDGEIHGVYLPNKIIHQLDELRYKHPTQSLAEIKAEAVMDAAKHIKEEVIANETYYTVVAGRPLVPTSMIEDYANKIKGGEL